MILCNAEESYAIENSSCTAIHTILANSAKNDADYGRDSSTEPLAKKLFATLPIFPLL